jgi:exopolyphosphatase/guanosine-5'-triphosphate,3'-diphosphate pyrophosphatase
MSLQLLDDRTVVDVEGHVHVIPVGPVSLSRSTLTSDPPRPEELSNAIGAIFDHLDDLVREVPAVAGSRDVAITGELARVVAAVEYGGDPPLPFALDRSAAEDVFRTVATEGSRQRALNPGLPSAAVDTVVGASCMIVAVMRHLHLDAVDLDVAQVGGTS